jgi:cytochrome P450
MANAMIGYERMRTGVTFNPLDKRYFSNPYPLYRRLRERDPVHRSWIFGGWVATRYEDVLSVLHDGRFSSDERNASGFEKEVERMKKAGLWNEEGVATSLLRSDPPDHTRLRKLVSKAFTPRAVQHLEPQIEKIVEEHLDAVARSGEMDVIRDIAYPLPVLIIATMIGVPKEDQERFKHWSNEVVRSIAFSTRSDERRAVRASRELHAYFHEIAEIRRREPREDLLSGLLAAEDEGDRLTNAEVFSTLELLLVAGNETTTNLIGNGTLALLRNPEQLELLQADPERIRPAIEELVRYDGPVQATARIAMEDLELGGRPIERGQNVFILLGAANRDPERFADPDRLDILRPDNQHLGFGHGVHFCLGANLARLEARHALGALVRRFPNMKLATNAPTWRRNLILHGMEALPVRF